MDIKNTRTRITDEMKEKMAYMIRKGFVYMLYTTVTRTGEQVTILDPLCMN